MKKAVILLVVALFANVSVSQNSTESGALIGAALASSQSPEEGVKTINAIVNNEEFHQISVVSQTIIWLDRCKIYLKIYKDPNLSTKYPDALDKANESLKCVNKLHDNNPYNSDIKTLLGDFYCEEDNVLYDGDKAIRYYKEVVEIHPRNLEANKKVFNLYLALSNKKIVLANEITGFSKREIELQSALFQESKDYLRDGLPYGEMIFDYQPDIEICQVLMQIYDRLGMLDKMKAMHEKLIELQQ